MTRKKHILVISQYFYPEQFRINDICCEWIKRGYKVTVLTGIPNYPAGKFFDGYSFTKKRKETWNGIDIIHIPIIPRGHKAITLALNYISFVVSGYIWKVFTNVKADYVFSFEVSPMTQVLIGCWYAKKNKIPHYAYIQDLWPENVQIVAGINNQLIIKSIDKMVDYIYKHCDEIFATSQSFVDEICNRKLKVDKNKVHYWPQYAEEFYKPIENAEVDEIPNDDNFKIIFTGNIGSAQGLDILPKTAELLKNEKVTFVMVGDGRCLEEFNKEVKRRNVEEKFIMIPRQPAEKIPYLLSACDVAFLSFKDNELWKKTIPAKLQSYMACGMPIIAAVEGETRKIIIKAKCGLCSDFSDYQDLANKIRILMNSNIQEYSDNSLNYSKQHFTKSILIDEMEDFFLEKR